MIVSQEDYLLDLWSLGLGRLNLAGTIKEKMNSVYFMLQYEPLWRVLSFDCINKKNIWQALQVNYKWILIVKY